eukprot:6055217-Alexandrium_andersonii.AAC.1
MRSTIKVVDGGKCGQQREREERISAQNLGNKRKAVPPNPRSLFRTRWEFTSFTCSLRSPHSP